MTNKVMVRGLDLHAKPPTTSNTFVVAVVANPPTTYRRQEAYT
jgi:hypothetical protein